MADSNFFLDFEVMLRLERSVSVVLSSNNPDYLRDKLKSHYIYLDVIPNFNEVWAELTADGVAPRALQDHGMTHSQYIAAKLYHMANVEAAKVE